MFLALRDIRFAKGRFALMATVVVLVTLLLVLLSSLTRGLGQQSTSAVTSLTATRVLLAPSGTITSWGDSTIPGASVQRAASTPLPGGSSVQALTVSHARVGSAGQTGSVALFGVAPAQRPGVHLLAVPSDGDIVLPVDTATQLHVTPGASITVNDLPLRVVGVEPTRWYSHSPVAWVSLTTANRASHATNGQATALLVTGSAQDAESLARQEHLTSLSRSGSINALPGYRSEHGSLLMIQGFLYGIGGLVIMAFLSVWTIQRTRDIAVLRALGASRRHVLGDSLGQAALLLAASASLGLAVGASGVRALRGRVPIDTGWTTSALPALGILLTGLVGALLATRRVTRVDPLLALGGN